MKITTVELKNYSSIKVGGKGEMVTVTTTVQLVEAVMYAKHAELRPHILGEGTNTFFGENLKGILFIKISIKGISFEEEGDHVLITACAGEIWDDVVKFAVEKKLWGIENLSSIPGTVGAAPVQNIGAYGVELADVLLSLSAFDRETNNLVEISNDACRFGYRDSLFKQEKERYVIISITIELSQKANPILTYKPLNELSGSEDIGIEKVRDLVLATRKKKLPNYHEYPNVGSFFKNPIVGKEKAEVIRHLYLEIPLIAHGSDFKIPAAWLIEHVALMKDVKVGNIGTWHDQPLVIVNYGEASARNIQTFSEEIIKKIEEKTGIRLEREVNYVSL